MGLVTSVILGTQTPINVREYRLVLEVYCPKDTAAYTYPLRGSNEKRGLRAFRTFSAKNI
jgi:hypothetical protein